MKTRTAVLIFLIASLSLGFISGVTAATTPIEVNIEGFGDVIDEITGNTNHNGGIFWNGNSWATNPTAAHAYFTDLRTGNHLYPYINVLDASVANSEADDTAHSDGYGKSFPSHSLDNYTITKQVFYYTKVCDPQKQSGSYQYGAVEYRIADAGSDNIIILVSRGSGSGLTTNAYFDVYIENHGTGKPKSTIAFINDPIWYSFPMDAVSALSKTDLSSYRVGSLSGAADHSNMGDFYLDINGGSDMGGVSYELHTSPLSSKFAESSSSYITSFEFKFTNTLGNASKIVVRPTLISEVYNSGANPSPTVPEISAWTILPILVAMTLVMAVLRKRLK